MSSQAKSRTERCLSASQIAKDVGAFDLWADYQGCEEVSFSADLPSSIKVHTDEVFELLGHLPNVWMVEGTKVGRNLARFADPEFLKFLAAAKATQPDLFSADVPHDDEAKRILGDLQVVFMAWESARRMRESSRKWSEADYAAGVYGLVRRAAIRYSEQREQCTIALPQPLSRHQVTSATTRILKGKTAKPDGSLFVPTRLLVSELCEKEQSPFNILHRHSRAMQKKGASSGDATFRYQATLCARLPDACVFEVASAFWEDKKPSQDELAVAYRQNRMASTAALRQLHALNVRAPVFGLVWADGSVRAHTDWWDLKTEGKADVLKIYSAAYGNLPAQGDRRQSSAFHQWNLAEPADIIQVYLFMRNLDRWTTGAFRDAVVEGVTDLARRVKADEADVVSWRRKGDLSLSVAQKVAAPPPPEPDTVSAEPAAAPAAKQRKAKKRKHAPRTSLGSNC
ncbi:hypothetical protein VTO73DRAFT_434 [Trametes versicolor]